MFVKLTNGKLSKFPYTLGELRRDNPGTSFPRVFEDSTLASYEVFRVTEVQPPSVDSKTHRVVQSVELVDNTWTQTWQLQRLAEDRAAENVRAERNRLLSDSDWTQLPDAPLDAAPWATYRQALRDISSQAGFPWDVQWPDKPE